MGSVIGFLLKRHQQKLCHGIGSKFDVEQPRGRGNVVDVLPHAMICDDFQERSSICKNAAAAHGLKGRDDFGAPKAKSGSAAKRRTGDAELVHVLVGQNSQSFLYLFG
jgi:hypothetical protein